MKSGNEAFDSEIRKRLTGVQSNVPEGVFEKIIEKRKKRRGAWLWFSMAGLLLLITGGALLYDSSLEQQNVVQSNQEINLELNQAAQDRNAAPDKNQNQANQQGNIITGEDVPAVASSKTSETPAQVQDVTHGLNEPDVKSSVQKNASNKKQAAYQPLFEAYINADVYENDKKTKTKTKTNSSDADTYVSSQSKQASGPLFLYPATMLSSDLGGINIYPTVVQTRKKTPELKISDPSRFSVEFTAGFFGAKPSEKNIAKDTLLKRMTDEKINHTSTKPGIYADLNVFYMINRRFSAGAGLLYSTYQDQTSLSFESYYTITKIDSISYYILFPFTPPMLVSTMDTFDIVKTKHHDIRYDITYSSLSAAGWIRYALPVGRFIVEPQAGISVNVYTKIKGSAIYPVDSVTQEKLPDFKTSPAIGVRGGINLVYSCTENLGLILRTGYQFGITPFATQSTLSEISVSGFTASIGARWNFLKRRATKSYNSGSDMVRR